MGRCVDCVSLVYLGRVNDQKMRCRNLAGAGARGPGLLATLPADGGAGCKAFIAREWDIESCEGCEARKKEIESPIYTFRCKGCLEDALMIEDDLVNRLTKRLNKRPAK